MMKMRLLVGVQSRVITSGKILYHSLPPAHEHHGILIDWVAVIHKGSKCFRQSYYRILTMHFILSRLHISLHICDSIGSSKLSVQ